MAILLLLVLLCDPSACSRELLSPESSDCDHLSGVIFEKKHAKWLTSYILQKGIE